MRFEFDSKAFVAIDTPGVRKRKSLANDIEFYSMTRALRSIRRADVVLMFFDASQTVSMVDKQLVGEIAEQYKPCIFVINKWDLGQAAGMTTEKWSKYLLDSFGSMRYVPVAFITAQEEVNVKKLINLAQAIYKQALVRVPTAKLNSVLGQIIERNHPPMKTNRRAKIFYATQISTTCSDDRHQVQRSATDRQRLAAVPVGFAAHERTPFEEVPIKVYYRSRHRASEPEEPDEPDPSEVVLSGDDPLDFD